MAARPKKEADGKPLARIEARVTQETKEALQELARADLRSETAELEWLIREEMARRKKE